MRTERGATLIELMVALALLSSIAVLSAQLVIQSTKLIDTTARASRNPDLVIATEWIRRDLYEAVSVVGEGIGWTEGPLVIVLQNGGWVAFSPFDGRLLRTNQPPGSLLPDNRVLLGGVVGWRWRVTEGGVLQIALEAYANPHAHQNLTGARSFQLERWTERLSLALRGRPGRSAW